MSWARERPAGFRRPPTSEPVGETCATKSRSSSGARTHGARSATSTKSKPPGGKSSKTQARKRRLLLPSLACASLTAAKSSSQASTTRAPRCRRNSAEDEETFRENVARKQFADAQAAEREVHGRLTAETIPPRFQHPPLLWRLWNEVTMASPTPSTFGQRAGHAFRRLLVSMLVLALAGVVCVLLARDNARTFSLKLEGGKLLVQKGRMLPWGSAPYRPADASLADVYAPIDLAGASVGAVETDRFEDRDELDR